MSFYSISHLPQEDRPRERLVRFGPESMATAELIAIILGSGTKSVPILQLAQEIISQFGSLQKLANATISELCQIKGVGIAKAVQLKAAISLGMRASKQAIPPKYRIENPIHAYYFVKDELENELKEIFMIILQDTKGYVICHEIVSIGTLSSTLVHPREVFYPAIRHKAHSLILFHNQPSGDPTPSSQDYQLTQELIDAGRLMGISIHDHLIIGHQCYVSLRQKGLKFL